MSTSTRIHPTLLARLTDLAGDAALVQASFADVHPAGPEDLPELVGDIIAKRRETGTAPRRQIPVSGGGLDPPDWLCRFAREPDAEGRRERSGAWPAAELRSPLELEANPVLRFHMALALRARATFGLHEKRWPAFIHVVRWVGLAAIVWLVLAWTQAGLALLVLGVAGIWMLLATPHVGERVAAAAAVAEFNDALARVLAGDATAGSGDTLERDGPGA